ncbi:hypothetical protein DFH08DRAFT_816598 [Mycena albidolilacea]|uniref:Uncharacterized protein n=1 Tax=Mycena albidolilacea TaxID=1033008 RepID=A0AAD7EHL8_9AGAR|nr:hypothetical protein DFH08DRAFT_816598 [Mycena albidolilacea]
MVPVRMYHGADNIIRKDIRTTKRTHIQTRTKPRYTGIHSDCTKFRALDHLEQRPSPRNIGAIFTVEDAITSGIGDQGASLTFAKLAISIRADVEPENPGCIENIIDNPSCANTDHERSRRRRKLNENVRKRKGQLDGTLKLRVYQCASRQPPIRIEIGFVTASMDWCFVCLKWQSSDSTEVQTDSIGSGFNFEFYEIKAGSTAFSFIEIEAHWGGIKTDLGDFNFDFSPVDISPDSINGAFGFSSLEAQLNTSDFELNLEINITSPNIWQSPV